MAALWSCSWPAPGGSRSAICTAGTLIAGYASEDDEMVNLGPQVNYSGEVLDASSGKKRRPLSNIHVKVTDGKVTFLQFQEDTYATAASFRKSGSWTVQTEPSAEPFVV